MVKSPFKIKPNQYNRVAIHNSLFKEIESLRRRLQFQADLKFGKSKFKISFLYASKKLGEMLK